MPPAAKPTVKLRHLSQYRVLLCESCGYCVLPVSLGRHLKSLHRLPVAECDPVVNAAYALHLATHDEVVYPDPRDPPVSGLPTYRGFVCGAEGCSHLCVTWKRMQAHWRITHPSTTSPQRSEAIKCRPVTLQTFFRANHLRYFVVNEGNPDAIAADTALTRTDNWTPVGAGSSPTGSSDAAIISLLRAEFNRRSWSSVLPVKSTTTTWRDQMLQVGGTADFLRYALLSVTASHVAYEHASSRQLYESKADKFRLLAIKSLPVASESMDDGMFFAMFNFSRLMTITHLARGRREHSFDPGSPSANTDGIIPEWINVQRRGRALVWPRNGRGRVAVAMHAPSQQMLSVYDLSVIGDLTEPHVVRLWHLEMALAEIGADIVCLQALQLLRQVWATPDQESAVSHRDMALMWTARAPEGYLQLLQACDPAALVVFAHFCVLWTWAEPMHWYMKGHAVKMLTRVTQALAWEWQSWISWPLDVVFGPPKTATYEVVTKM